MTLRVARPGKVKGDYARSRSESESEHGVLVRAGRRETK